MLAASSARKKRVDVEAEGRGGSRRVRPSRLRRASIRAVLEPIGCHPLIGSRSKETRFEQDLADALR